MAKASCTPELSRRGLLAGAAVVPLVAAVPAAAADLPARADVHMGRGELVWSAAENSRDRLLAEANASVDGREGSRLTALAWDRHTDILTEPCCDRTGAIHKLRALLHPEIGCENMGDFQADDATCVREVLAWLEQG